MNRIRWLLLPLVLLAITLQAKQSQDSLKIQYEKQGGNLSLGVRSTVSAFNHGDPKEWGYGLGGHFRLQLIDRLNTEWYADILSNDIKGKAHRYDYHIGWSVMFYIIDPKGFNRKLTPFVEAGHCFDLTRIRLNGPEAPKAQQRLSSAVQMGLGCHYNITPKFDITLKAQYMLHLGKELHAHEEEDGSIEIEEHKNAGWEGHLLVTLSFNYKFLKLWKPKK